jgi:hypothetical protein
VTNLVTMGADELAHAQHVFPKVVGRGREQRASVHISGRLERVHFFLQKKAGWIPKN